MQKGSAGIAGGAQVRVLKSLRTKLLMLIMLLSLVPLAGVAGFSFYIGSTQIAKDIRLSLEKMAQDTADKIDIILREKREEVHSMAGTFSLIYPSLRDSPLLDLTRLLNGFCFNHDVFDVLVVLESSGEIVAINSTDRNRAPLLPERLAQILRDNIRSYPEEKSVFDRSITGQSAVHDWYRSKLVGRLYDYQKEDVSQQYNIAISEPIWKPTTHEIEGVLIGVINWAYFQNILDNVEMDLANLDLGTGYAFMFAGDANTIIAHKYRANRQIEGSAGPLSSQNLYATRLVEDHGLKKLHDAILRKDHSCSYQFPKGNDKISGLAPISETSLGWIVGVGIDGSDIFRPIRKMSWWLAGVTVLLALLVVVFTVVVAHGITIPVKNLIATAQTIAQGNFSQRVQVRSSDEVGILGSTFNDMARALSDREQQLQELNRNLEGMVRQRTVELENSHEALKRAYFDLQNAQEQLVQTEKMASLGQLVAGVAHEIKNPLNFIYGNTGFLADYTRKIENLLQSFEKLPSIAPEDRAEMERLKESIHYSFIKKDLRTLIDNFTEGARRINQIVSDLRTFSRMDTDALSDVDVHAALEVSLNLLRNQYKNRIEIHREYGDIPRIQGYAGKLNQVFMNLLANAFHAVRDQGDVWIRTRSSNGAVEIEIEDNGVGIPKENLKRIFEPFFTTKPVGQGTGLGLSISYGIIEQHRGRIHVTSVAQKGSKFTVRLPVFQEKGER